MVWKQNRTTPFLFNKQKDNRRFFCHTKKAQMKNSGRAMSVASTLAKLLLKLSPLRRESTSG
jgi:hypothetical protein